MSLINNIFEKKHEPIRSYADFWIWFQQNKDKFFDVVKSRRNIEKDFFNKLSPKLSELKDGYFYLTGMLDDNIVELVLTADGNPKNIVFVEELVNSAPEIEGWKITAHKQPMDINKLSINMGDYEFSRENLDFYANESADYPDQIDISVIHNELNEENRRQIESGIYIFLDNYLGEIDFLTKIDNLKIIGKNEIEKEPVPISELKEFLIRREGKFVEKYEGVRYDTENDAYSILEAELQSGNMLLAVINTDLLNWNRKASHPWISVLTLKYDGSENNGMPDETDYALLNNIEEEITHNLKDKDGYLDIGRQTAESEREIYFACNDFREPSKVFYEVQQKYSDKFEIEYDIYKDKYWQSFERFNQNQ